MFVCNECGQSSPDPTDFCYSCGSMKGYHVDETAVPEGYSYANTPGGSVIINKDIVNKAPLALLLAFIPGLFNIFGLGQLFLKRYVQGILFLAATAGYFALKYGNIVVLSPLVLFFISMILFVLQLMDVYRYLTKGIVQG